MFRIKTDEHDKEHKEEHNDDKKDKNEILKNYKNEEDQFAFAFEILGRWNFLTL